MVSIAIWEVWKWRIQKVTVTETQFSFFSCYLQAQAMALTIADAFKMAFINYEKAKVDKCHDGSRLAQYESKDLNQQGEAVVNKGFVEADTNPETTMEDPLNAPIIQVTEGTSSLATEKDLIKKMQALVKYFFIYCLFPLS